jgi:aminoglycoside phosphotransferase (APT) family kinase protein
MTSPDEIDLSKLARIGQGRTAEVFALDDGRVIKVAREGVADLLDREATAMRAAHSANMPVPAAHALVDVAGRRALIMDRARGVDMLTQFGRRPWTIIRAGAKLGRLHAKLHETVAPAELPSLKQTLLDRIAGSDHVPPAVRDRVLPILRELPDGDRLCHLDFHPANVITDGATMTVIDWPGACRGDPLADVALTTITLQGGKPTPGTPLITRLLAPIGRKLLLGGYSRSYRKHGSFDRERFARWIVVAAAQRLTYDIAGEEALLLRVIERGP